MPDILASQFVSSNDINKSHNLDVQEHAGDQSSDFFDEDNFQLSILSFPNYSNIEAITLALAETQISEYGMAQTFSKNFGKFPMEIQNEVWKNCALDTQRTITILLTLSTFVFVNCPATPAFMQVCKQARKIGLDLFKVCDADGRPQDINIRGANTSFYFFLNPFGDDFILRFGEEKNCPNPAYCPRDSNSSYMKIELKAAESDLESKHEELLLLRLQDAQRARRRPNALQWQMQPHALQAFPAPINLINFAAALAANHMALNVLPPPTAAGEPVFPPGDQLPEFFTNIRSVGINLDLPFAASFDFSTMSPLDLQNWAKKAINGKFNKVFTKILDKFPNLEHTFVVVRAHGRSNQDRSNGYEREIEKKPWLNVGIAKGEGTVMGYEEFAQVEKQVMRWFMDQRLKKGLVIDSTKFTLYVQTNLQWEI